MNYSNSKIYKISSPSTEKIYIGSTTQLLCKRKAKHLTDYKNYTIDNTKSYYTSFDIIKLLDYKFEVIEQCNYNNKQQLHEREGYYIKLYRNICVNKRIAGRKQTEYIQDNKQVITEYQKEYHIINKEVIAEKNKQYRNNNKEVIAGKKKLYRNNDKEVILEKSNEYYINNKEVILEIKKQTIQCECGFISTKVHLSRHQQTLKHFINKLYINELQFYNT